MEIFHFIIIATPTPENPHANNVGGAYVCCWAAADDPDMAISFASFKIRQYGWNIQSVDIPPIVSKREMFAGDEIMLNGFDTATKYRLAITFFAWASDGNKTIRKIQLNPVQELDLETYLKKIKNLKNKSRCFHYDAGNRCTKPIKAHSIQKNGALSLIAEDGHVYTISKSVGDWRSNDHLPYRKESIGSVSTFRGFCEEHDNILFRPIDVEPLYPHPNQIPLYAYRSICRELFVKENALQVYELFSKKYSSKGALGEQFEGLKLGTKNGLDNLVRQKSSYDKSLKAKAYDDFKYVLFCSDQKPNVVFSGLIYPCHDFQGNELLNLGNYDIPLKLITFSFAKLQHGWGLLFAWHVESSNICVPFMRSLATIIHTDKNPGDILFRLVISSCENMAMAPAWWERLDEESRRQIAKTASQWADIFSPIDSNYLVHGLEGISGWTFNSVIAVME